MSSLIPHLTHVPRTYEADPTQRWPLMLFLHGAGERGTDLRKLRKYGPPRLVEADPDFPFVMLAPQCPTASYWHPGPLLRLLDDAAARFRVDPARVVATGVSMGGYGTWELGAAEPERFAALAPICGGGDPRSAYRLKEMPIWAFHGEEDDIVPLTETLAMISAVRAVGGTPRLTTYPGVAHDSWEPAYATPELFEWLLAQRKGSVPASPT